MYYQIFPTLNRAGSGLVWNCRPCTGTSVFGSKRCNVTFDFFLRHTNTITYLLTYLYRHSFLINTIPVRRRSSADHNAYMIIRKRI